MGVNVMGRKLNLPKYFGEREVQKQRQKRKRNSLLVALLQLALNEPEYDLCPEERLTFSNLNAELVIRNRTGKFRPPPKSCLIWGIIYFLTFMLPKGLLSRITALDVRKIEAIRDAIAAIYEELFSDNGKYCVSSFTYPHTVPGFHFHSALGYQLFEQRHKVRARAGCKTNIEKWEALPHDEKLIGLRAFYNAPTISLKEDVKKKMCALYRQNLINIFGAGSVEGCSDDQLLWATYMPLKLESHRRSKGVYMKNKQLTYLDDAVVRYDKTSKLVTVKFYSRRSGKRRVRTYDVPTFIRECLVKPGRGFFGLRFYARGAYHGRSGFKSVLEFAYRYPEALPEYDRIRRNAEELDVNQWFASDLCDENDYLMLADEDEEEEE